MDLLKELSDIPMFDSFIIIEPINKGWSTDKKFYIENNKGEKLLLKVFDKSNIDFRLEEYNYIKKALDIGIYTSYPIDFGICSNNKKGYQLFKWIEGNNLESELIHFNKNKQYKLGIASGQILKQLHTIPSKVLPKKWDERYKHKIDRVLKNYYNSPLKIDNDKVITNFIKKHKYLLKNRPEIFQHGDFHVGNLILDNSRIGVIDYNRMSFGDPFEEFNRIIFSANISKPFAIGQIKGYFNNRIPDDFFILLALYIAVNTLSSIPWALPFGEKETSTMLSNAKKILIWYDNFNNHIPIWFN